MTSLRGDDAGRQAARGRARVTLKLATSLDGRIATGSGESKWITGRAARDQVHRLRAEHDAVLVGSQTVVDDDPLLTVRLPEFAGRQPLRVVADGRARTSINSKLVQSARAYAAMGGGAGGAVVICIAAGQQSALERTGNGVSVVPIEVRSDGHLPPSRIVEAIADIGVKSAGEQDMRRSISIFLEGGGQLAASFLREGLIDRIEWFRAPIVLGDEGRPALGALGVERLADAPRFNRIEARALGADLWERYVSTNANA